MTGKRKPIAPSSKQGQTTQGKTSRPRFDRSADTKKTKPNHNHPKTTKTNEPSTELGQPTEFHHILKQEGVRGAWEWMAFHHRKSATLAIYNAMPDIDSNDFQDLFSEAYIRFYQALQRYTSAGKVVRNPGGLLNTIARRCTYSHLDRLKRRPRPVSLDDLKSEPAAVDTCESRDAFLDLAPLLHRAISELSPCLQPVVIEWFRCGGNYQEIAEALDMKVNTVRKYFSRAAKQLRASLPRTIEP